jgi:hypothetical protein
MIMITPDDKGFVWLEAGEYIVKDNQFYKVETSKCIHDFEFIEDEVMSHLKCTKCGELKR